MDHHLMRRRVETARVARLATVRPDGSPRLVPCCYVLQGDRVLTAVDDAKPKSTLRLGRLGDVRNNPRASILVDHYDEDWARLWWVRLDGAASVVAVGTTDHVDAIARLVAKYEQYRRSPPPGEVIALEVSRWLGWP
jgi:PPOX class probable F420-dependent enzyme